LTNEIGNHIHVIINLTVESQKFLVEKNRIWQYGFVIMPNHIHLFRQMQEEFRESDVQPDFLKFITQGKA
jgi:REP element-mobilizing transposase RayT